MLVPIFGLKVYQLEGKVVGTIIPPVKRGSGRRLFLLGCLRRLWCLGCLGCLRCLRCLGRLALVGLG